MLSPAHDAPGSARRTPTRPHPTVGRPRQAPVRRDIQGLRALAVTAVVADHAGVGFLAGGYVGVDIFFVLSGYLITSLLVREVDATGRIGLAGFYARRARRILPAATLVLVATSVFTAAELSYARVLQVTTDAGWAAVFLANVRFSSLGTDYFAASQPPSPVQHFWSLAVEEQFYVVWPLVLLVLLTATRRRRGAASARLRRRWVVAAVAGLAAISFGWSLRLVSQDQTTAYFSAPGRAWELGVGALLALAAVPLERQTREVRLVLATGGLAAMVVAILTYDASTRFPGWTALLPVLGTAAVVAAGVGTDAIGPARILTVRAMTWLGDRSYSWYLWHWPVLVLWGARTPGGVGPFGTAVLVAVSLGLATAGYRLVEDPLRRSRWLAGRHRRGLVLWPLALTLVLTATVGTRLVAEQRLASRFADNHQYASLRSGTVPVHQQLRASLAAADDAQPVAFPLTNLDMVGRLARNLWNYRYRCNATYDESTTPLCPVGDVTSPHVIVVLGDSHVGEWLPALDRIGRQDGYRVLPMVKYGCTPYDVDILYGGQPWTECQEFRAWATQEVAALHPDLVVVGGRGLQRNMATPVDQRASVWTSGVTATIRALAPLTRRLVVLGDVPALGVDPIGCLTDTHATMATCTTAVDPRTTEANDLTAAAARLAGVDYVGLGDLACVDGRCPVVAGGLMVYANEDHLSRAWVAHVTPEFRRRVAVLPAGSTEVRTGH